MVSFEDFCNRFLADQASESNEQPFLAARRVGAALEALGWRSASDTDALVVAELIPTIFGACVAGHGSLDVLRRDIALYLRGQADSPDTGSSGAASWEPMEAALIDRYVTQNDLLPVARLSNGEL